MKSIKLSLIIISLAALMYSCEEEGPNIDFTPPKYIESTLISDSSETPQTKMILIEEFTGVKCPNCPNAALKVEELQNLYPNRILATAIHFDNAFGTPYLVSKYDFRTTEGKEIFEMLPGVHNALPIGDVSRTKHIDGNGNNSVLQFYPTWSTFVTEELAKTTPVNIYISGSKSDSIYKCKVKLHYTQDLTDTQALTIYVIEDNLIDLQKKPDNSIDSHYVHKHILRKVVSSSAGDIITVSLVKNRVIEREYDFKINPEWTLANCSIIAFVHKRGFYFDVIHAWQKPML